MHLFRPVRALFASTTSTFLGLAMLACLNAPADAARCGSSPAGFEAWKREFAGEARAKGIGASGSRR